MASSATGNPDRCEQVSIREPLTGFGKMDFSYFSQDDMIKSKTK
jgi:hypothetical protein